VVIGAYGWGIDGIIRHGKNGFLVKPGDPESLKIALNQIMGLSTKKRQEIASAARETVLDLSSEKVAKAYLQKIKELKK
jgi:glycosyltransferase involved in cell wall biosynthesis